jgi:hypothetical protein
LGKFAKNRGTPTTPPPPSNLVISTLFSLKSLGHSPARDFFLGVTGYAN